ncbi:MAG: hypothetical protein O0V67_01065 [Methanocorpusculum sp.]|nr:hypothetical protein [Methanocorpusculum sp.]
MANEFERAVVICINRYFTEHRMKGFAYRLKHAHFNTHYIDIIVSGIQFTIIFERIYLSGEFRDIFPFASPRTKIKTHIKNSNSHQI